MVPGGREGDGRLRDHPDQVLARGQPRRADPAAREPDRRPAQDLEALRHGPEVLQPVVRLLAGPRRHVRRDRHRRGRRGSSRTPTTRSAAGSTSSPTCSASIPYEPLALPRGQAARSGRRPATTSSPISRCATSRRGSERRMTATQDGRRRARWHDGQVRRARRRPSGGTRSRPTTSPSGSASTPPSASPRRRPPSGCRQNGPNALPAEKARSGLAALPRPVPPPTCRSSCSSPASLSLAIGEWSTGARAAPADGAQRRRRASARRARPRAR